MYGIGNLFDRLNQIKYSLPTLPTLNIRVYTSASASDSKYEYYNIFNQELELHATY